jgi:hypothetical protein
MRAYKNPDQEGGLHVVFENEREVGIFLNGLVIAEDAGLEASLDPAAHDTDYLEAIRHIGTVVHMRHVTATAGFPSHEQKGIDWDGIDPAQRLVPSDQPSEPPF